MKITLNAARAAFLFICLTTAAHAAVSYSITDLGTLGGTSSFASDVNNNGDVVGNSNITNNTASDAFLWHAGTMVNLGNLGISSAASGINDSGQIVGNSVLSNDGTTHAFLYDSALGMQDLGTLGGSLSSASAINNLGQVVGSSRDTGNVNFIPFLYSGGTMVGLGSPYASGGVYPGQLGDATGINSNGAVVGYYFNSDRSAIIPFLRVGNATATYDGLGGGSLGVGGVNSSGAFVGSYFQAPNNYFAFVEDSGGTHFIGSLGGTTSNAIDINDSGAVVGQSTLSDNSTSHAFIYSDGTMYDLNDVVTNLTSGGFSSLLQARAVSDTGFITGTGRTADGQLHAFLLTPTVVPEPSTALFGVIGVIGLCFRRTRK